MAVQHLLSSPIDSADADLIVDLLIANLSRNHEAVRASVHGWPREGCHLIADALKRSRAYDERNTLGDALRSLANVAIIREHRLANP